MSCNAWAFTKLISGGQSGVDRAALDLALELGIPCGGWCPKGRTAEDGTIADKYPLEETPSSEVSQRTEWNVKDSDGTLILYLGDPKEGTTHTMQMAQKHGKPYLVLELDGRPIKSEFEAWIGENNVSVLNVAGPRESHLPGQIYLRAREFLRILLC